MEKNKKSNIKKKKKKNQVQALNLLIFMLFNIILLISISANAVYTGSNLTVIRTSQEGTGESVIFNWEENVLQNTESFSEYNIDNNPYGYLDEHDASLTRDYANSSDFYTEGVGSSVVETNHLEHDTVLNFTQDGGYPRGTLTPSGMNKSCWNEPWHEWTFDGDVGGNPSDWTVEETESATVEVIKSFENRDSVLKFSDNTTSALCKAKIKVANIYPTKTIKFHFAYDRDLKKNYFLTIPGVHLRIYDNKFQYLDPKIGTLTLKSNLNSRTWYEVLIHMDDYSKTCDVYFDEILIGSNLNYFYDVIYDEIEIIINTGISDDNCDFYVDDVKVQVWHCSYGYYHEYPDAFNDEIPGNYTDNPTDLAWIDEANLNNVQVYIEREYYGHKNILNLSSDGTSKGFVYHYLNEHAKNLGMEYYIGQDRWTRVDVRFYEDDALKFMIYVDSAEWRCFNGTSNLTNKDSLGKRGCEEV